VLPELYGTTARPKQLMVCSELTKLFADFQPDA
jgi:hypothetical protein